MHDKLSSISIVEKTFWCYKNLKEVCYHKQCIWAYDWLIKSKWSCPMAQTYNSTCMWLSSHVSQTVKQEMHKQQSDPFPQVKTVANLWWKPFNLWTCQRTAGGFGKLENQLRRMRRVPFLDFYSPLLLSKTKRLQIDPTGLRYKQLQELFFNAQPSPSHFFNGQRHLPPLFYQFLTSSCNVTLLLLQILIYSSR